MSGNSNGAKATAEIVERRGELLVRIKYPKHVVWATRDQNGKIRYDRPEMVRGHLQKFIVPALFKEIDRRQFGVR